MRGKEEEQEEEEEEWQAASWRRLLSEDEAGLAVHLEHLLYGVDVGRRPQVQTQLVLVGRSHDLLHQEEEGQVRGGLAKEDGRRQEERKTYFIVPFR